MTFEEQMDERYRRWLVKLNWTGSRREFEAWKAATEAEQERCASRSLAAVDAVLEDLCDRRGLRHEWGQIELEAQLEIMNAWKDAIVAVMMDQEVD